jgi:hypothetical protein
MTVGRYVALALVAIVPTTAAMASDAPRLVAQAGNWSKTPTASAPVKIPANVSEIRFSVPYSFTNVPKDMKAATIACFASTQPTYPEVESSGAAPPQASVEISLHGQPKSGTATLVIDKPGGTPSLTLAQLTSYTCTIRWFNNGQPAGCYWEEGPCTAKPGSVRAVKGTLP